MRRTLSPSLALLAGLVTFLAGCAGETPTAPGVQPTPTPPPGCKVTISLAASSFSTYPGLQTPVVIRATVKQDGAAVPDGSSVYFTTDRGFFGETGLPTVSKVIISGVADVTLYSTVEGEANVVASFACGTQKTKISFVPVPIDQPFVSSINPTSGKCEGGETITINGGHFDYNGSTAATTRVTFGGVPATITSTFNATTIIVKSPGRTLANPQVPESVDIVVTTGSGTAVTRTASWTVAEHGGFTYFCVGQIIHIASLSPISGPQDGGTVVTIAGSNFGTNVATTRVTFGGTAASISAMSDTSITVSSPRHPLASQTVPETVDVSVTKDLGLVSQQNATLALAFTYRGTQTSCPPSTAVFISSITPLTGSPNGGLPVTIRGGGFGTVAGTTRVEFGGIPAQVTAVTDTSITASTPRRVLASPSVPEVVDVVVTVDVGGPHCTTATLAGAFTYTNSGVLKIYSSSPRTGPNDVSTRVTVFGTGFTFPMQVLLGATGCGSQKIEAVILGQIQADQFVFQTPIAANGNACLANQLASITVVNPNAAPPDNTDTYADAFKYYSCPTASVAVPAFGPYGTTTTVTINGNNFAEPVQATWVGGGTLSGQLVVSSVSAGAIVVEMPPVDPKGVCANISGTIALAFPALSCATGVSVPYTYKVDPPQVTGASPTQLSQTGCAAGVPACSVGQTITVSGSFFSTTDPVTVVLTKDGSAVTGTTVNNATVNNAFTLTFPAPAVLDGSMNEQNCVPSGSTTVTGTMYVPTSFGIRVTNTRTGCSATLPNVLVYSPLDTTCRTPPIVTAPATLPAATLCTPYAGGTATAAGGTGPYTFVASGLPNGVTINGLTGVISGTPTLTVSGPGATPQPQVLTVTITATDALAVASAPRTYALTLTDPGAPLAVTGAVAQSIPATGSGTAISAAIGMGTINWSITGAPAGMTVTPTGASTTINTTAVASGTYPVTVVATDSACAPPHTASLAVSVTIP